MTDGELLDAIERLYVRVSSEKDSSRTLRDHRTIITSPSVCEMPASVFVTTAAVFVMRASVFLTSASVLVTFASGTAKVAPVREMAAPVFAAFAGRSETVAAVHFREELRSAKPASGSETVASGYVTFAPRLERGVSVPETRRSVPEMTGPGPETTVPVLVMGVPVLETGGPGFVMTHPSRETVATGAEMVF